MAWSIASSWEAKCRIVVSASDSAMSSVMPLPRQFFHSVRPATVPARSVCSSHKRGIAGDGGVQGRGLNSSAWGGYAPHQLGRFSAPQLRPRKVADLSWIDDAHDVPSLMERKRDAQAVASGCLQTGVNLSDLVFAEPGNQLMPASGRIGEALGARLCANPEVGVDVFSETSMPSTASVILRLSLQIATATAPHRSTLYTGSAPERVPGYRPA